MSRFPYAVSAITFGLLCSCGAAEKQVPRQTAPVLPEKAGGDLPVPVSGSVPRTVAGWLGDGSGCYPTATPTIEWSSTNNVAWSIKTGPNRYSSPCLVDGKLFLVAEPSRLICVDAAQGKILWQRSNDVSDLPEKVEDTPAHGDTGNTTPTPVSDGRSVYASFGSGIVACYDVQGQRKWLKHLAGAGLGDGRSASPVLVGDTLLVSIGHLTALDTKTGKPRWQAEDVAETYGTSAKAKIGGVDVVITPNGEIVRVADGVVLANTAVMLRYASPIVHGNVVYFMDSISVALQLPNEANENLRVKKLWETSLEGDFFATPVYANGLLFGASDQGKLIVMDTRDGKLLVNQDIPIASSDRDSHIFSSLTRAGPYVFLNNTSGETLVIEASCEYRAARTNRWSSGSGSTPVFEGRRMYARGSDTLYCVGNR